MMQGMNISGMNDNEASVDSMNKQFDGLESNHGAQNVITLSNQNHQ